MNQIEADKQRPNATDSISPNAEDDGVKRETVESSIARAFELAFREIADSSVGFWPVEIQEIKTEEDGLLISALVPFLLPNQRQERRSFERFRDEFAQYFRSTENVKKLNSFILQRLFEFFTKQYRLSEDILERLAKVPQKTLAGRPRTTIPVDQRSRISDQGKQVLAGLHEISKQIISWKKRHPKESTIARKILESFGPRFPWVDILLGLDGAIPRRRYLPKTIDEAQLSEQADPEGARPPCKLSEPEDWSMLRTAAKIVQAVFQKQAGEAYPLLELVALIRTNQPLP
jgi:hypothetical protein